MASAAPQPVVPKSHVTQEHKNRTNLNLLLEKGQEYSLGVFHTHFPKNSTDLYNKLSKHQTKLKKLFPRVLKQDQWDLVYPASQQTDSSKFDITLTFLLIRKLCGYSAPLRTGWDNEPDVTDNSVIANCIRIKLFRNRLNHDAALQVTNAEYKVHYKYICNALIGLGCPKKDLKPLSQSVRFQIASGNPDFIGRSAELTNIHQSLIANTKRAVVITGFPGLGKSELARKYIEDYGEQYDNVIWVNAENVSSTFTALANILDLSEKVNPKIIAQLLQDYFKNESTLFVWDNCSDYNQLSDVLKSPGYNIITTQSQHWANNYEIVELNVWPKGVAYRFVDKIVHNEKDLINNLIEQLGYHPLAINHALSYIQQSNISLKQHLNLLKNYPTDLLDKSVVLHQGLQPSVFVSFMLTIEKIEQTHPSAFQLLTVLGVLDGSFMHEDFVQRSCNNTLEYIDDKKTLLGYSMIKCQQRQRDISEVKYIYLEMHSLYQLSIRHFLRQRNLERKTINRCYEMMVSFDDENYSSYQEGILWAHQMKYIWQNEKYKNFFIDSIDYNFRKTECLLFVGYDRFCKEMLKECDNVLDGQMSNVNRYWIKWCLICLYDTKDSKEAFEQLLHEALNNVEDFPPKEKLVSKLREDISNFDEELGQNNAMVAQYFEGRFQELLNSCQKASGVRDDLLELQATSYKELGRYHDALSLLKQYPQNKLFCSNKTQLGCLYILMGLEDKASKIIDSIDFDGDRIPGLSLSEVARAYFDVGSYDKCRFFFMQLREVEIRGPSFSILDSCCKMLILNDVKSVDYLKEFLLHLLEIADNQNILNTNHIKFRTKMLFCCCLIREEEYLKAKSYAKEILDEQKQNPSHENCFREPLLYAKYLKLRRDHQQALVTLKIVEYLQKGLNIVEKPTLNGMEIDIQRDMDYCANRFDGVLVFSSLIDESGELKFDVELF